MIFVSFWFPFGYFWNHLAAFWHPWAPSWRHGAQSWNICPSGANSWSQADLIEDPIFDFCCKKSVLGRLFRGSFFWFVFSVFWLSRGTPKPWKSSKTHVVLHENKVEQKSKMQRPESTLRVILALILMPWGIIFQIFIVFWPCVFQLIFATP